MQRNKDEFANGTGQKLRAINNEADSGCKCWLKSDFFFHSFLTFAIYILSYWRFTHILSIIDQWSSWKSCFLDLSLLNILLRFLILQRLDKLFSIRKSFGSFILRKIWVISKKYLSHTRIRRILLSFSPFSFSMAYHIAIIFPILAWLFMRAISSFRPFCHKLYCYFFLRSTKSTFLFFVF